MLTPIIKKLVEERIKVLDNRNDVLARQIQFYSQRVVDYQANLAAQTKEVEALKGFIANLVGELPTDNGRTDINVSEEKTVCSIDEQGNVFDKKVRMYKRVGTSPDLPQSTKLIVG